MTFREVQALVLLYRACADPELRARVLHLVPDLADWDVDPKPHRWVLVKKGFAKTDGECCWLTAAGFAEVGAAT
jgi:hypothetical protein